jgi:hypothetical protein
MSSANKWQVLGTLAVLAAGMLLAGCKSAPELKQSDALALIQAKYDQAPPVGANITLTELGLNQGLTAKYWKTTKVYPNKYWVDFTLTDDGKKAIQLPKGGAVIEWRPESIDDKKHTMVLATVVANHLKARDIKEIRDESVPTIDGPAKVALYTESVSLDGVPEPLQQIAHNPGNKLSSRRTANFALDGGAWKLFSIE